MTSEDALLEEAVEELFEDAPCGYVATRPDGTIVKVNRTFESWTGHGRGELVGRRFQELLAPGGRIYYETHYAPLLVMQGFVREIALDVVRVDGSRLPALVNATVRADATGAPQLVRTTIFDATERRRFESELVAAHRREQDVAQHLQRSLLQGELPASEKLDIGVLYRPAFATLEVGGDWYDAFWIQPDRTLGLVVGDVVGRGIGAAATMGQLRSACRALASTGLGPAAILEGLDRYAARHDVGQMATVVVAELELATGRLRYACAGHPPPVVLRPGGMPELLEEGRSVPLDAFISQVRPRPEAEVVLPAASTLLLYTDGIVERRGQSLPDGFAALLDAVAQWRDTGMEDLTRELAAALRDPDDADDVCLLGVRVG